MTVIALLTDFGLQDTYVGQMKLVIASVAPGVPVVDLGHGVEPQNVLQGAWLLETALPTVPEGAVVVAVVDPGVGTSRRALAVRAGGRTFLGPDNGLLSCAFPTVLRRSVGKGGSRVPVPDDVEVRSLDNPAFWRTPVSATFHGRDVFAPAAAWLARGVALAELGHPVEDVLLLPVFEGWADPSGVLYGEVVHVDRFGNLVSTIRAEQLPPRFDAFVAGVGPVPFAETFASADPGAPLCHVDSSGYLAFAVREGSAASRFRAGTGSPVEVRPS